MLYIIVLRPLLCWIWFYDTWHYIDVFSNSCILRWYIMIFPPPRQGRTILVPFPLMACRHMGPRNQQRWYWSNLSETQLDTCFQHVSIFRCHPVTYIEAIYLDFNSPFSRSTLVHFSTFLCTFVVQINALQLLLLKWRRPLSGYFVQLFHMSKKSPTHKNITSGTVCLEIGTFYSLLRRKGWPSTLLCKYILVSMFANIVMILYAYRSMVIAFGVLSRIRQWW